MDRVFENVVFVLISILCVNSAKKKFIKFLSQNDFQDIVLTDALFSMHQLRKIEIYVTDSRVMTYGYDGLIIIRDSTELRKVIGIFMPHHRSQGGVKRAISSRSGETIVSLGRNGDLVANRIRYFVFTRSLRFIQIIYRITKISPN